MTPSNIDPAATELLESLQAAVPSEVHVGVRPIAASDEDLTRDERAIAAPMAPVRRNEFATGRALLRAVTGSTETIPRAPTGAPELPVGWTGSLAHDGQHAIAVATQRIDIAAIGVDFEALGTEALGIDETEMIMRPDDVAPDALAAFVMKEAVYKTWSALGGQLLDHHHVRLHHDAATDGDSHPFRATVLIDAPGAPTEFSGQLVHSAHHWFALVIALRHDAGIGDDVALRR